MPVKTAPGSGKEAVLRIELNPLSRHAIARKKLLAAIPCKKYTITGETIKHEPVTETDRRLSRDNWLGIPDVIEETYTYERKFYEIRYICRE